MKFDLNTTIDERCEVFSKNMIKGKRYLFKTKYGDYEADYVCAYSGEPDIEVRVSNVVDFSPKQEYTDLPFLVINLSDIYEINLC